jgi:lysophospholipase L1-like esterase
MTQAARRQAARVVSLAFGTSLVMLAEGALRLAGFEYTREPPFQFIGNEFATGTAPEETPFVRDERRFWRLKPGAQTVEDRQEGTRINEAGFRGPWPSAARQPGSLRIAFLGDSSTYGIGVPFGETYAAKVAARLHECLARTIEIAVAGTHGYSSLQARLVLDDTLLTLQPDILTIYLGAWNDFTPAIGGSDAAKLAAIDSRSATVRTISSLRLYQLLQRAYDSMSPRRLPVQDQTLRQQYIEQFEKGTQPEGPRVSPSEFQANLAAMIALARSRRIEPVLITPPLSAPSQQQFPFYAAYRAAVDRVAAEWRVPVVHAAEEIEDREAAGAPVFSDWVHPSAEGHDRIAARTAAVLAPLLANPKGGAPTSACSAPADGRQEEVRFLLREFPAAVVDAPQREFVRRMSLAIGSERRYVLFQHPESSVEFPVVRLGLRPSLRFGIGMNPDAWSRETDGVEFRVALRSAGGSTRELYRRHLNPRQNPSDRKWIDETVSLSEFANEEVQVILRTHPGPTGNNDFDWSAWSGPVLVIEG